MLSKLSVNIILRINKEQLKLKEIELQTICEKKTILKCKTIERVLKLPKKTTSV